MINTHISINIVVKKKYYNIINDIKRKRRIKLKILGKKKHFIAAA